MTSCGLFFYFTIPPKAVLVQLTCRLVTKDRLAGEGRQEKNYIRSDKLEIIRGGNHKETFTVKCAFL